MKKLTGILILFLPVCLLSQTISFNGSSGVADSSAVFDAQADNKGVLFPRMSSSQRDAIPNPANGLLVYDTDAGAFWQFNGTTWIQIRAGNISELTDADSDTKILVEESADEDKIHMYVGGEEIITVEQVNGESLLKWDSTSHNMFLGHKAGSHIVSSTPGLGEVPGQANTFVGQWAGENTTTGYRNTIVGHKAFTDNTSGHHNVVMGFDALGTNTTGHRNVAVGHSSIPASTTGYQNSALGSAALYRLTTGHSNVGVGEHAGWYLTTGSNNTFVGRDAGNNTSITTYSNCSALGYNAVVTGSNQIRLGNSSVSQIGGYTNWTNVSDGRIKRNVQEDVVGLDFITQLRPITYQLDMEELASILEEDYTTDEEGNFLYHEPSAEIKEARRQKGEIRYSGMIAQEVLEAAESVNYQFSGVDIPQGENGLLGLKYADFVVPLIRGMQEQQKQIEELQNQVQRLERLLQPSEKITNTQANFENLDNEQNKLVKIYPNPTSDTFSIEFINPSSQPYQIFIYGLNGDLVTFQRGKTSLQSHQIDVSHLASGVYKIIIQRSNEIQATQLIRK